MDRDIELLYELGALRFVDRTWKHFLNPDVANVTEHTFRVVFLALILASKEKGANQEKVMKMALIHDVPESRTGDANYLSRQYVDRKEDQACEDILFGTALQQEFTSLWHEAEAKQTLEAKIVKDADTLDVELELKEQAARGHSIGTLWQENRQEYVYSKLFTKTAKLCWEKIHTSNPNDWHLNGKNRFLSGDWKK